MKDHPILFNGEMVNAIRDGRKTQTRRVIRDDCLQAVQFDEISSIMNTPPRYKNGRWGYELQSAVDDTDWYNLKCPYGVPGDLLWVRETLIRWCESLSLDYPYYAADKTPVVQNKYANVYEGIRLSWLWNGNTRSSIYMPKWACRLWLRVKSVRVERVQEITGEDCIEEGAADGTGLNMRLSTSDNTPFHMQRLELARNDFRDLWDSINKDRGFGWDVNPWVWVVEFEKEQCDE